MLVEEIPVALKLLVVHFRDEPDMRACSGKCSSNGRLVLTLAEVQVLPRREESAHRRADEQYRALFALHSSGFVALVLRAEVPWLAVIWVDDREVESESWCQMSISSAFDILRDPRRGVDIGNDVLVAVPDLAPV